MYSLCGGVLNGPVCHFPLNSLEPVVATHWVRTGVMGSVGIFTGPPGLRFHPGQQVICRTDRGLETGQWLAPTEDGGSQSPVGSILRPVNSQDALILERLERFRNKAISACEQLLAERGVAATLLDAEHLFDGGNLIFYFLEEPGPEMDAILGELAARYDQRVGFSRFSARLAEGCGPGCGTTKSGCSPQACASCGPQGCANRNRTPNTPATAAPKTGRPE